MHQCMWYVHTVTSTSANATMMRLPLVAKREMSHPIIHHFKKAKIIQPHTSKYCQFHRISHQEYISNISYCAVVTDSTPGYCSGAAWNQGETTSLQLLCEVISSCQRRNVASHNPSFQKSKHDSAMHIKILSISSWIIVQTYFTTYLPQDELLIYSFEKQNQAKQHHSKCINTCDTYILLPAPAQTQPWWNYQ